MATKYCVAAGDTYPSLARLFYRDDAMADALAAANRLSETAPLLVGQELVIPYITQRHVVDFGDTLYDLAQLYYGNGAMFPVLSSANHIAAPYLVKPGDSLLVPDLVNMSTHTVYPGDTLAEFAIRWYNDKDCDLLIAYANNLTEQHNIELGQALRRPGLNRRHTVEPGETWPQLGQWWYGDPALDRLIALTNGLPVDEPPPAGRLLVFPDLAEF
jgi:nucleoid-associated protein YgaU